MHHFDAHELADSWELRAGLLDADPADASISACLRECAAALRNIASPAPGAPDWQDIAHQLQTQVQEQAMEIDALRDKTAALSREAWEWSKALEAVTSVTADYNPGNDTALAVGQLIHNLNAWKATTPGTAAPAWASLVQSCRWMVQAATPTQAPAVGADDAKRLDWLEQQRSVALTRLRLSAKPGALTYWCVEDWDGDDATENTEPEDRQTLRAAIDAAMAPKPPVQGTGDANG